MFRVFATAVATAAILRTVILTLDAPFSFAGETRSHDGGHAATAVDCAKGCGRPVRSTPEAASLVLLGGGLIAVGARVRRRSSR
jgi:hypothetical protein